MSADNLLGRTGETPLFQQAFSPAELIGGFLLPQIKIREPKVLLKYDELGAREINVQVYKSGGRVIAIAQGFPVTGMEVNHLLHFAAPSKDYGLDTYDLVNDWANLYTSRQEERLLRHSTQYISTKSWHVFENVRLQLLQLISRSWEVGKQALEDNITVNPVMVLSKTQGGVWQWHIDSKDDDLLSGVKGMPELGPILAGAFSSDITARWDDRFRHQNLGSTQAFPLVLDKKDDLLAGRFVQGLLQHVELDIS